MTWQVIFQSGKDCVSWQTHCVQKGDAFDYFQHRMASCLYDAADHNSLTEHLHQISFTGMCQDVLKEILAADEGKSEPSVRD